MPKYHDISILDSCAMVPLSHLRTLDAAQLPDSAQTAVYDSLRILNPTEIFGSSVSFSTTHITTPETTTLNSQNWQPPTIALIIICLFCFSIYRYANTLRVVIKNIWSLESTIDMLDNPSREFFHFITASKVMLTLSIATLIGSIVTNHTPTLNVHYTYLTIGILITLKLAFITQGLINRSCGTISNNQASFFIIRQLGNLNAACAAYIITPIVIIISLNPQHYLWACIPTVMLALFHFFRIFVYLKYEKFSFLQWFLYLCAVELLPLTLPILMLTLLRL